MILDIDLHGMTRLEAQKTLEKMLASAPKDCEAIHVVHGYRQGDAIMAMVRDPNALRSRRIKRRRLTLNRGETILELYV